MSPLEEALRDQKHLINKGYSTEEIHCAATMLIAEQLTEINAIAMFLTEPQVVMKEADSADD